MRVVDIAAAIGAIKSTGACHFVQLAGNVASRAGK
jgi:hypothetical protein